MTSLPVSRSRLLSALTNRISGHSRQSPGTRLEKKKEEIEETGWLSYRSAPVAVTRWPLSAYNIKASDPSTTY